MKKSKKILAICMASAMATQMGMVASNADVENVKKDSILGGASRIAGMDRYETANKISEKFARADTVIIASGTNFPDALCAAPLASKTNSPILLSKKDMLISNTIKEIKRLKATKAIIVGGENTVGKNVETQLKNSGLSVSRIAGDNKYETSIEIAKQLSRTSEVFVANGEAFSDALSISEVAAQKNVPILLSQKDKLPSSVDKFISDIGAKKTYVIGGENSLSKDLMNQVPGAKRIAGADRYETSAMINDEFKSMFNFEKVYVASGKAFPDALAGAPLSSMSKAPLVLVGNELNAKAKTLLETEMKTYTQITIFGGENVVSNKVVEELENLIPSGGGGGGSKVEKPTIVKNSMELKAAIENTSITKIDLDDNYVNTENVEATREGSRDLTINFKSEQNIQSLTINAEDIRNLTLKDNGMGDLGAKIDTLTINTPKAHVINDVQTRILNIEAVSQATLVTKDMTTEDVNMNGMGTLEVIGEGNVNNVNVGPNAKGVKIMGDKINSVNAKASVQIDSEVEDVTVPADCVGVRIFGSGNLGTIQTQSPIAIQSAGSINDVISNSDLIIDSNVENLQIQNTENTINVNGLGKIANAVVESILNLNMEQKVDKIESDKNINLNSPVGEFTANATININTNSTINLVKIYLEGLQSSISGSGVVDEVKISSQVSTNVPLRTVDVVRDANQVSVAGDGYVGKVYANSSITLNNGSTGVVEVPSDATSSNIYAQNGIEQVLLNKSVTFNTGLGGPILRADVLNAENDVRVNGFNRINNINTMKNLTLGPTAFANSVTAEDSLNIKVENFASVSMFKLSSVTDRVNLIRFFSTIEVTNFRVKQPDIELSSDESCHSVYMNPNEENFEDVKFTIPQEQGVTYYYTLDGSDPDENSNLYSGEVTIDPGNSYDESSVVIKVVGMKDGETESPITSKKVVFAKYNQKNPTYTNMVAPNVLAGQSLSSSLIDGDFNTQGTVEWVNGSETVNVPGYYMWKFVPDDTSMFNEIRGIQYVNVD